MKTEGGIRIPYIMRWNGTIPAGQTYKNMVSSLDVFPTAMAAASAKLPGGREYDGVDLVPFLNCEKKTKPHEILFWRRGEYFAVRRGNWKIVKLRQAPVALFDLSNDIGESNDLANKRPEILNGLMQEFDKWQSKMVEPLWEWHPKKK
jgi:arylsulfatase A-like enzyme